MGGRPPIYAGLRALRRAFAVSGSSFALRLLSRLWPSTWPAARLVRAMAHERHSEPQVADQEFLAALGRMRNGNAEISRPPCGRAASCNIREPKISQVINQAL